MLPKASWLNETAQSLSIGALRYYMLRFSRNRVVAFDLDAALAFEGETGPYLQYAAARARSIFDKIEEQWGKAEAEVVAEALEKRMAFRRAIKKAIQTTMQAGSSGQIISHTPHPTQPSPTTGVMRRTPSSAARGDRRSAASPIGHSRTHRSQRSTSYAYSATGWAFQRSISS